MTDTHTIFKENLAAYALGALDLRESAEMYAHLQTCDTCPAVLAAYENLSVGLLASMPPQSPPASIKRALQKRISGSTKTSRPRFALSPSQWVFGAALVLLPAMNIVSILQVASMKQQQAELASQYSSNQTAISMLAYPTTQSISFDQNGVSGSLLVDKTRNLLAVFAWHLSSLPQGRTYQVWLIDSQGDRTSGGFISPDANEPFVMSVVSSPRPLAGFVGLGVTIEPLAGSPKPTGPNVFRVNF